MTFDVNQTEIVSKYQREVWGNGVRIVPLDVSLARITDPEMIEGCTQVHTVTMEILTDMYNNPQEYDRTRPNDYLELFFRWHADGKRQVPVKVQNQKGLYEHILDRLGRFGFTLNGEELTNARYPLFLHYRNLLNQSFDYGSTIPCDFRLLIKPYKRTTDDLLRPLPDRYKEYWRKLFEYAASKGAKLESRKDHMFRWKYKDRFVLTLTYFPPYVEVPYQLKNSGGNRRAAIALFLELARQQPDSEALLKYIQDNLCPCTGCPGRAEGRMPNHRRCGQWFDIGGKRRLAAMCHSVIGRTKHGPRREPYTAEDVVMLKRMIDLRFLQLEAEV